MKVLQDVLLGQYTTFRIGGQAKYVYFPESTEECVRLLGEIGDDDYRVIGGGSNLLINDQRTYEHVIVLTEMDAAVVHKGSGLFEAGASVRLQKLIDVANREGYGGIEYLYSVPGRVGGALVMNAGRGAASGLSISDHAEDVTVWKAGTLCTVAKHECGFGYRRSTFQHSGAVVLSARFRFRPMSIEESTGAKRSRVDYARTRHDATGHTFGSLFMEKSGVIMRMLQLLHPGYRGGVRFSGKSANWLVNDGGGTFAQAIRLIDLAVALHRVVGKRAIPEVVIWR